MMSEGSGTLTGWDVEARYIGSNGAKQVNDQIFTDKWQRIRFYKSPIGVKHGSPWKTPWLEVTGLFSYESAQALRWWFYSGIETSEGFSTLCLETRLVRYKIEYKYNTKREGAGHHTNEENTRWVDVEELNNEVEKKNLNKKEK